MKNRNISTLIFLSILFHPIIGCKKTRSENYLVMITDTINDSYGYRNIKGDTIIALEKYSICYTDTFRNYAVVLKPKNGFVAIDRDENVLYDIFTFDNGPDYTSEGLFRIMRKGKIGFADSLTGKIVIEPKFKFAFPFKNGIAKVSNDGRTAIEGEHKRWKSENWFYIDKAGNKKNGL